LQNNSQSSPTNKATVAESILTVEEAPSAPLDSLRDTSSDAVTKPVATEPTVSTQDGTNQMDETEVRVTPALGPSTSGDRSDGAITTPRENTPDKPRTHKRKRTAGISTKATKLQYLAQQRANRRTQKQADNAAKDKREQPPLNLNEIQKEQIACQITNHLITWKQTGAIPKDKAARQTILAEGRNLVIIEGVLC